MQPTAMIERAGEAGLWGVHWTLEKFDADLEDYLREFGHTEEAYRRFHREHSPFERREIDGNLLVNNGIQIMLDALIGTGITAFSNANARIGVGDSSTAAAATQTDLQAATNKLRKAMDATFPSRANQTMSWKSSFTSGEANFAWAEWGIFNAASGATSMLNRKVEALGTKSTGTWTLQGDVTIS
jgi:hypothetical protein